MSARGLRNGRSGMIALALPDLLRPYSAEIVHLVVELAHERGWGVQIEQTAAEPKREFELLSKARAYLVDGLILNPVNLDDSAVTTAGPLPPLVLIGDVDQDLVSQVAIDNVAAARDMTKHLLAQGCRRIAAVGTPEIPRGSSGTGVLGGSAEAPGTAASRLRTAGYRQALEEAGVPIDPALEIGLDRWRPEGAATVVGKYLAEHELPDAFFCFTDSLASGASSALWSAGVAVPGQTLRGRVRQHPREPVHDPAADDGRLRPAGLRRGGARPARRADGRQGRGAAPGDDPAPDRRARQHRTLNAAIPLTFPGVAWRVDGQFRHSGFRLRSLANAVTLSKACLITSASFPGAGRTGECAVVASYCDVLAAAPTVTRG